MELLANKIRPTKLDQVIGQQHLIGENKVLTNLVKNGKLFSMILYGRPGIGKTSIANALINELNIKSKFLNATTNNKADFEIAIEEAKMYGEMILVIDEIHRMNKAQQDILLPHIESGLIILIGLTTSNPYHKINPAIRSRCQIYELKELTTNDIIEGLKKAEIELPDIKIDDDKYKTIYCHSDGYLTYNGAMLLDHYSDKTKVEKLNEERTIEEIARIASGDINDISMEHAKQLRAS